MRPRTASLIVLGALASCGGDDAGTSAAAVAISVDSTKTYQTWRAWGALTRRWDSPHLFYGPQQGLPIDPIPAAAKEKILDLLYTDLKLDLVEVGLNGGSYDPSYASAPPEWSGHEPQNDNADPFTTDTSRMNFAYWAPLAQLVKGAVTRIQARGDVPVLTLRVMAFEHWMTDGSGALLPSMVDEYAEWVTAFVLYMNATYGWVFDAISLRNEPGSSMNASVMAQAAAALDARLSAAGFPGRVSAPETTTPAEAKDSGYLSHLANAGIAPKLRQLRYHNYDYDPSMGQSPNLASRRALRDFARQNGIGTVLSEFSSDVKQNRRTYWKDTPQQALAWANDFVTELLETEMVSAIFMWGFWTDSNPLFGTDAFVILDFDAANNDAFVGYRKPVYYSVLGEFINNIRPGMVRIEASSADPSIRVVAFARSKSQQVVLVAVNNGTTAKEVRLSNGVGGTVPPGAAKAFSGSLP